MYVTGSIDCQEATAAGSTDRSLHEGREETNALWLAIDGNPMSDAIMGELVTETTTMTVL
jgi:hypothetical protein